MPRYYILESNLYSYYKKKANVYFSSSSPPTHLSLHFSKIMYRKKVIQKPFSTVVMGTWDDLIERACADSHTLPWIVNSSFFPENTWKIQNPLHFKLKSFLLEIFFKFTKYINWNYLWKLRTKNKFYFNKIFTKW